MKEWAQVEGKLNYSMFMSVTVYDWIYLINWSAILFVRSSYHFFIHVISLLAFMPFRYDLLHNAHLNLEGLDELFKVAQVHKSTWYLEFECLFIFGHRCKLHMVISKRYIRHNGNFEVAKLTLVTWNGAISPFPSDMTDVCWTEMWVPRF